MQLLPCKDCGHMETGGFGQPSALTIRQRLRRLMQSDAQHVPHAGPSLNRGGLLMHGHAKFCCSCKAGSQHAVCWAGQARPAPETAVGVGTQAVVAGNAGECMLADSSLACSHKQQQM